MGLAAASQELAKEGGVVYMADVDKTRVNAEAETICKMGGKAVPCVCDLREWNYIQSLADRCTTETGRIDVVINFAGGLPARMCGLKDGEFIHELLEVLDWGIAVNFRAPMLLARVVMEQMMNQKSGVIINIGSVAGETGGAVDYAAEKTGLTYDLRRRWLGLARLTAYVAAR